ncbi:probable carbohydrate esterase At4g34215 [Nicotiana sylvestris]|uniref:Probable carbohydrate esterase At4g34215 n=1 Tax=Nicotiana sylvestris TaxID=4096 RepID=A0A1U7XYD0_NICSY|nr:PREDICTED: probable carbohydrate esterase At4g34215 [Nicotiana sylvestris]XP_009791529.1 PREDICTED: probable carbohydrate esterase At4g34215 [Nicotiana sylvestris]XP_009791530.1 PREDICTED: probable carbohydrate esterase At4g34215 [Nicotiana sylvestris]XP_009791531.1 PREDICTED: probable carbohydrate esterase At4g34215 [Nicotiana sylvestris]XP_009791532.1 PREDICTED: probable carbohydrate esterase At4g34215 [Nicotiana sylvestris]XP_009791533.1 PREDICTED: probable carbohydrate esterase At4g3421
MASAPENEAFTPEDIFILSGQSNMSGRGGVDKHNHWDGIVPPECCSDPAKIFRLSAHLNWEMACEPLHRDIDTKKTCGIGPGMSFANAIKDKIGAIGLVPCAVGGTALKEWGKGTHLYENMINRARAAMHQGGKIKALLWYQGESDTLYKHRVETYKANMEKLIHNVRADLYMPFLPIIQVAIASGEGKYTEKIRQAQKRIDLPNVVCIDAMGLQLKEDNLHLTSEAQVKLGQMFADAYLTHFAATKHSSVHSSVKRSFFCCCLN